MLNPVLIHNWQYLDNGWSLIDSLGAMIDLYTLPGREAISRDLCIGQTQHASVWLVPQISLRDQDSDFGLHRVRNVGALWRSIPGYHLLIRPPLAPAPISSDHAGMQANNRTQCVLHSTGFAPIWTLGYKLQTQFLNFQPEFWPTPGSVHL